MVAILERHVRKEEGRINFTFYVSFDAIPFRQLDGHENPGFPYPGVPVISEKIRYLDEHFILGIHSLSHVYAHDMGPSAFARSAAMDRACRAASSVRRFSAASYFRCRKSSHTRSDSRW